MKHISITKVLRDCPAVTELQVGKVDGKYRASVTFKDGYKSEYELTDEDEQKARKAAKYSTSWEKYPHEMRKVVCIRHLAADIEIWQRVANGYGIINL